MDHQHLSFQEIKKEWKGSFKSYVIGFFLSLIFTSLSFYLVLAKVLEGMPLLYSIVALAITQAAIQLIFFVHLGQEDKPKWESLIFFFMLLLLSIIAAGTIWIMQDLDARVMVEMHHD
jgi:cytochrome o ubiquinol oxidase operon protein cyoD